MPDEIVEPSEPQSAADIEAARREFLSEPPPILDPSETPEVSTGSEEDAAIEELLSKPPAGQEGAAPAAAPAPAPAPTGTPPEQIVVGHDQFGNPIIVSREQAYSAWQVQEALRTEAGVRALVSNGLTALGYSVEQVRAALDGYQEPEGEPDPLADLEDDDMLTVAQARQLAERAAAQAAGQVANPLQEMQQVIAAQQQQAVQSATDAAITEALGPIPIGTDQEQAYRSRVDTIVARAGSYYDPNQWANPQHIRQAVQRAAAELASEDEARFQAYLASKRASRQGSPPNISGGAGTDGPLPEPKDMAQAREQARAAGFFQ